MTVKVLPLIAVPAGVRVAMCPVRARVGTVACTSVSEIMVNWVAFAPPKVTALVCVRPAPVMVTTVPTGPLVGVKPLICGVTRNTTLLLSVPAGVTTVTLPVVAPAGTVVVISELDTTVNVAAVPLKLTLVVPVRLFPRIFTVFPTFPEVGSVSTKGPRPTAKLKIVPQPMTSPWYVQAVPDPPWYVVP